MADLRVEEVIAVLDNKDTFGSLTECFGFSYESQNHEDCQEPVAMILASKRSNVYVCSKHANSTLNGTRNGWTVIKL